MANNYTIVPVFQVRNNKKYNIIQEDSRPKIFSSESDAQKFVNQLNEAFDAGVESVVNVTQVTK